MSLIPSHLYQIFGNVSLKNTAIEILSSNTAILIYVLLLLFVISMIIISIMFSKSTEETPTIVIPTTEEAKNDEKQSEETVERFCMLSNIDKKSNTYGHQIYEKGITLESFCEDFRNYAASRLS
ncbi:MAG: hypothetical protein J6S71_04160, partial [Clostridia bacterium]|nr:hypothetical protein [Clostridia bacterium]